MAPLAAVPVIISAVSAVAGVAATGFGAMAQANQAKSQAKMQSAIAEQNAKIATDQANYNASLKERALRKTTGSQKAALAASGVSGGSAEDISYDTIVQGNLDQLMTKWEGQVQATNYRNQASAARSAGNNTATGALVGGALGMVGAAASGFGETYSIYNQSTGYGTQPSIMGSKPVSRTYS